MEYSKENLAVLLNKQQWTVEDYKWFLHYADNIDKGELEELMHDQFIEDRFDNENVDLPFSADLLKEIHSRIAEGQTPQRNLKLKRWMAVAASVIGVLVCTYIFYTVGTKDKQSQSAVVNLNKNDVAPGKSKAVLKLSNGLTIALNEEETRHIADEGHADILKDGGKLSYNKKSNPGHANDNNTLTLSHNTLTTPRGGQFQLQLADGTMVWLNSASDLQFPAVFNGKERRVKLSGEAYFEVAKNKKMPFIVEVASSRIEVLGTHFNIKAYNDEAEEPLEATLLEGAIKFTNGTRSVVLKPGQQAALGVNGALTIAKDVNTDEILAWKKGLFHFEKQRLESIMRELSRWYDIDVIYKDRIDASFFAEIPKNTNLSDALRALQLTGKVKFTIDGKKVMVFKQ